MLKAKKAIRKTINQEIKETWDDKVSKLLVQGEFTKLLIEEKESVTWQPIVRGLPMNILVFSMRLATDSLHFKEYMFWYVPDFLLLLYRLLSLYGQ